MILDRLENAALYFGMHSEFKLAFEFFSTTDFSSVEDGEYPLEGSESYVIVSTEEGRGKSESPLEFHRRFIDIQLVLGGNEVIGWRDLRSCNQHKSEYDSTKDIGFFLDQPESWSNVSSGAFAIFFPTDAHAPLAGQGSIRKAIAKVAVKKA